MKRTPWKPTAARRANTIRPSPGSSSGRRGAPFFLSPKDVGLIARWEKMRVPLDAVLEGMEMAFENFRKGGRSAKILTLGFCEYQVMKAFGRHAERKAGGARKTVSRDEKRNKLVREIERFLGAVPPGFEDLRASFERALVLVRPPRPAKRNSNGLTTKSMKSSGAERPRRRKRNSAGTPSRNSPASVASTSRRS